MSTAIKPKMLTCVMMTDRMLTCVMMTDRMLTCVMMTDRMLTCVMMTDGMLTCVMTDRITKLVAVWCVCCTYFLAQTIHSAVLLTPGKELKTWNLCIGHYLQLVVSLINIQGRFILYCFIMGTVSYINVAFCFNLKEMIVYGPALPLATPGPSPLVMGGRLVHNPRRLW